MSVIYFVEKNIHGAWVVYGIDGVKQYYGYSKAEAARLYKESCNVVVNQPAKRVTQGGTS